MTLMTKVLIALSTWTLLSVVLGLYVGRVMSFCAQSDAPAIAEFKKPLRRAA